MDDIDVAAVVNIFFLDDDNEQVCVQICDMIKELISVISGMLPREEVPRITNFAEITVLRFAPRDFRQHFRIDRSTFDIILQSLAPSLIYAHTGGKEQVTVEKQLMLFIWYMANQESMREISHIFGISLSTVHSTILRMIQWPDFRRQTEIAASFQLSYGIPNVIGIIDGTHIQISAPIAGDQDYINRKGYPSVVLQVVVDDNLMITSAQTGWPGCAHDARVLRNTKLFTKAEAGNLTAVNNHLLGDSAYPLKNWLLTPFRDNGHLNDRQKRYNRIVSSCRQTVERSIGHLKGRFRKLREIPLHEPRDICYLIMSGCLLHNLCIVHEDSIEEFIGNINVQNPNHYPNIFGNAPAGVVKRDQVMNMLP